MLQTHKAYQQKTDKFFVSEEKKFYVTGTSFGDGYKQVPATNLFRNTTMSYDMKYRQCHLLI